MRVKNKTDQGVYVAGYGVIPPGEEATVAQSDSVKQGIKADVLSEVKTSSGGSSGSNDNDKDGDA